MLKTKSSTFPLNKILITVDFFCSVWFLKTNMFKKSAFWWFHCLKNDLENFYAKNCSLPWVEKIPKTRLIQKKSKKLYFSQNVAKTFQQLATKSLYFCHFANCGNYRLNVINMSLLNVTSHPHTSPRFPHLETSPYLHEIFLNVCKHTTNNIIFTSFMSHHITHNITYSHITYIAWFFGKNFKKYVRFSHF